MLEKEKAMNNTDDVKEDSKNIVWKTGISQAFWCHTNEKKHSTNTFEPAIDLDNAQESLSWFDRMLHGGIVVPETTYHPLTLLLTGPPGAGKTTFALELVYRLINNKLMKNSGNRHEKIEPETLNSNQPPNKCIYISLESTSQQVIDKTKSFNWDNSKIFKKFKKNKRRNDNKGNVIVYGIENIKNNGLNEISKKAIDAVEKKKIQFKQKFFLISVFLLVIGLTIDRKLLPIQIDNYVRILIILLFIFLWSTPTILRLIKKFILDKPNLPIVESVKSLFKFTKPLFNILLNQKDDRKVDIIVIDSLNSLKDEKSKQKAFSKFLESIQGKVKFVIFLLDSNNKSGQPKFWEYICDIVIRIDSDIQSNYWLRTMEIEKIRYQEHVQGKQIFKIQPGLVEENNNNPIPAHSHPYRKEGGLFILPSIHFYLSYYKKHLSESKIANHVPELEYAKLYPYTLNELISRNKEGLIPVGRCTAFIGKRGGHKSHLGYLFQLHQMISNLESSLVISLRDDEDMTRQTMNRILSQEKDLIDLAYSQQIKGLEPIKVSDEEPQPSLVQAENIIKWFEENGRLEILYYHPGYITPEEFCHRMLMSIQHIKHDGFNKKVIKNGKPCNLPDEGNWEKLTVMFNSLDQLTARFPLCTKQEIFVPGLIDMLNGEKITSIFVAVNTEDQPLDQFGLLPMADLILSFHSYNYPINDYYAKLLKSLKLPEGSLEAYNHYMHNKNSYEVVEVEIERFAGGEKAGSKGTLELINSKEHILYSLYKETGLKFNQIYKNNQMRKYDRTNTNFSGNLDANNITIENISQGGIQFRSDKIHNISNSFNKEVDFICDNNNFKGTIKWYHYEKDRIYAGLGFTEPINENTEKSLIANA